MPEYRCTDVHPAKLPSNIMLPPSWTIQADSSHLAAARYLVAMDNDETIEDPIRVIYVYDTASDPDDREVHRYEVANTIPPSLRSGAFRQTHQCNTCPWRVDADPENEIPGYCPDLNEGLRDCGERGVIMACHKSPEGDEFACVGWLNHELGPGNNIMLRLKASHLGLGRLTLRGEQHECFEDTLPETEA